MNHPSARRAAQPGPNCSDTAHGPVDRPWGVRNAAFLDPDGHVWVVSADITAS